MSRKSRAAVKELVAAVVEAFVNGKLERTDISAALYAAAAEPEGAAVVRRLSKRVHRALTRALAGAAGPTLGDMECVALMPRSRRWQVRLARCSRLVRHRRWWFACTRSCWCVARGMRRSRWGSSSKIRSRVLKKSSVIDHDAVDHDRRNAEGASAETRAGIGGQTYLRLP